MGRGHRRRRGFAAADHVDLADAGAPARAEAARGWLLLIVRRHYRRVAVVVAVVDQQVMRVRVERLLLLGHAVYGGGRGGGER